MDPPSTRDKNRHLAEEEPHEQEVDSSRKDEKFPEQLEQDRKCRWMEEDVLLSFYATQPVWSRTDELEGGVNIDWSEDLPLCKPSLLFPLPLSYPSSAVNSVEVDREIAKGASLSTHDCITEGQHEKILPKVAFNDMRVLGQFNLGFILCEYGGSVFIVDQHASDEVGDDISGS